MRNRFSSIAIVFLTATSSILLSIEKAHAVIGGQPHVNSETAFARMQTLSKARQWDQLVAEFRDSDLSSWPSPGEAFRLRGEAFMRLKDAVPAVRDLKAAVEQSPGKGYYWYALAGACNALPNEKQAALDAYIKAYELDAAAHTSVSYGWMPISATLEAAAILRDRGDYEEALAVLGRYTPADLEQISLAWRVKLLRAYAQMYLGQGREEEALDKFREANRLES